MANEVQVSPREISRSILVVRGRTVLLDVDLATLYGVTTKALNQAVKRNLGRFPLDFAFRLTINETLDLARLTAASDSQKHRDLRVPPFVFTEHGAIMLAMVLRSPRSIETSVHVVRAFAALREAARANDQLMQKLQLLEKRVGNHDADIAAILKVIRDLVPAAPDRPRGIGFLADIK